jgi:hypothetical protein
MSGNTLMLAAQLSALSCSEVILHHDAVCVIRLVLQAPGQGACADNPDSFAELILATKDAHFWPRDWHVRTW